MSRSIVFLLLLFVASFGWAQIQPHELRVARGNEDYPPNEMRLQGKLTGVHVEIVEAVASRMGLSVKWVELPWARAQKCTQLGECDAITYISPNKERLAWGIFLPDNALSQVEMWLMVHKDSVNQNAFHGNVSEFLAGRTLLSVIGYNYGPEIARVDKYEVKDLTTMANMMTAKRYDVAVINLDDFAALKGREDMVLLEPAVWINKSYLAFSSSVPNAVALSQRFQTTLREFRKTREYADIMQRYKSLHP